MLPQDFQGVLPREISWDQEPRGQHQPGPAGNENHGQFDDAVANDEGPEIDVQAVDVAKGGHRSDGDPVERHEIHRSEPERHAQCEGQKRHGDVVRHDHARSQRADRKDAVEPDFAAFHLIDDFRGNDQRGEAVVLDDHNESVAKTDKEDKERNEGENRSPPESCRKYGRKERLEILSAGRRVSVYLAVSPCDEPVQIVLQVAGRHTQMDAAGPDTGEIGGGFAVQPPDLHRFTVLEPFGLPPVQNVQQRFEPFPARAPGLDIFVDRHRHNV